MAYRRVRSQRRCDRTQRTSADDQRAAVTDERNEQQANAVDAHHRVIICGLMCVVRRVLISFVMPPCFGLGGSYAYTDGTWVPRTDPPPYLMSRTNMSRIIGSRARYGSNHNYGLCDIVPPCELWHEGGGVVHRNCTRVTKEHLVRASPPHEDRTTTTRALYDWAPRHCSLTTFDRRAACRLLKGRQVLVVGDSATWQFFVSLVRTALRRVWHPHRSLLHRSLWRPLWHRADRGPRCAQVLQLDGADLGTHRAARWDDTASACGDTVRLSYQVRRSAPEAIQTAA